MAEELTATTNAFTNNFEPTRSMHKDESDKVRDAFGGDSGDSAVLTKKSSMLHPRSLMLQKTDDSTISYGPCIFQNRDYGNNRNGQHQNANPSMSYRFDEYSSAKSYGEPFRFIDLKSNSGESIALEIDLQSTQSVRYRMIDDVHRQIIEVNCSDLLTEDYITGRAKLRHSTNASHQPNVCIGMPFVAGSHCWPLPPPVILDPVLFRVPYPAFVEPFGVPYMLPPFPYSLPYPPYSFMP